MTDKLYTSYNWMRKKYLVERWSQAKIAEYCGTTQVTISRWLSKHGLK